MGYPNNRAAQSVSIASSGTISGALDTRETGPLSALQMPSAFTGTSITFQVSNDGSTYGDLYDEGTQYSVDVAADRCISLKLEVLLPWRFVKIVSTSSEAAERTLTPITHGGLA